MADLEEGPLEGETAPENVIATEKTIEDPTEVNNAVKEEDQTVEGEDSKQQQEEEASTGDQTTEQTTEEEETRVEVTEMAGETGTEEVVTGGEEETITAKTRRSVFENHRLETYIWEPEGTPR